MTGGLLDLIRAAKRPERTVDLCLRGDLVGEFEANERRLNELATKPDNSFSESSEVPKLAARQIALREEMKDSTVRFHLRALGSERTATLVAGNPPRPDNENDKGLGYNPATYYAALVTESCYALTRGDETVSLRDESGQPTDGALSDEDWEHLFDQLSNKQFDTLAGAAFDLDHGDIEVPFSPLASVISQRAAASSKQPEAGASRQASSQGGSGGRSRRSNGTKKAASSAG